ncbi:10745_t:CDS:2, partial [Scutellospora calospora]
SLVRAVAASGVGGKDGVCLSLSKSTYCARTDGDETNREPSGSPEGGEGEEQPKPPKVGDGNFYSLRYEATSLPRIDAGMPQAGAEGWRHTVVLSETNRSLHSSANVTTYEVCLQIHSSWHDIAYQPNPAELSNRVCQRSQLMCLAYDKARSTIRTRIALSYDCARLFLGSSMMSNATYPDVHASRPCLLPMPRVHASRPCLSPMPLAHASSAFPAVECLSLGQNTRMERTTAKHCAASNAQSDETSRHKHRRYTSIALHHEQPTPRLEDMLFEASSPNFCATIGVPFVVDEGGRRQNAHGSLAEPKAERGAMVRVR